MSEPVEPAPTPGSAELVAAIEGLADLVARYLTPTVRFVGHRDTRFAWLERAFAGLVHERRPSGLPAEVVVFDEIPHAHLGVASPLGPDAAYLFCLEAAEPLTAEAQSLLRERLAVTLVKPDEKTLLWHVRMLMLLRELSYRNTRAEFVALASAEPSHRAALAATVRAVLERCSLHVRVPTAATREALLAFLFEDMPPSISPARVRAAALEPARLHTDRVNLVVESDLDDARVAALFARAHEVGPDVALLVASVRDDAQHAGGVPDGPEGGAVAIAAGRLARSAEDARLLAYWCAAARSHASGTMRFYPETLIETRRHECPDPDVFIAALLETEPTERAPDAALRTLVDTYERFSLDAVLAELERATMSALRARSALVETASRAAGISRITFHKRARRHAERPGLLGLHAGSPSR